MHTIHTTRLPLIIVAVFLSCAGFFLSGCGTKQPQMIAHAGHQILLPFPEEIRTAQVICIGEAHNEPQHHSDQLAIIRELKENGKQLALGLEMFDFTSQPVLDQWLSNRVDDEQFRTSYGGSWRVPLSFYEEIFLYAKAQGIPLVGLNVPKTIAKAVSRHGFAALPADDKQMLPTDIYCDPDSAQMSLLYNIITTRGKGMETFTRFCEAHMLRDKTMAEQASNYLRKNPETTLVILAGIGHCVKQGLVRYVDLPEEMTTIVLLPMAAEEVLQKKMTVEDTDFLIEE